MTVFDLIALHLLSGPGLRLEPSVQTTALLMSSAHVTAGGVGGAVGVVATEDDRWLAEVHAGPLTLLGNALFARVGIGAQWQMGSWTPAGGTMTSPPET